MKGRGSIGPREKSRPVIRLAENRARKRRSAPMIARPHARPARTLAPLPGERDRVLDFRGPRARLSCRPLTNQFGHNAANGRGEFRGHLAVFNRTDLHPAEEKVVGGYCEGVRPPATVARMVNRRFCEMKWPDGLARPALDEAAGRASIRTGGRDGGDCWKLSVALDGDRAVLNFD